MHFQQPGYLFYSTRNVADTPEKNSSILLYRAAIAPMETREPLVNAGLMPKEIIVPFLFLAILMIIVAIVYLAAMLCRMYDSM